MSDRTCNKLNYMILKEDNRIYGTNERRKKFRSFQFSERWVIPFIDHSLSKHYYAYGASNNRAWYQLLIIKQDIFLIILNWNYNLNAHRFISRHSNLFKSLKFLLFCQMLIIFDVDRNKNDSVFPSIPCNWCSGSCKKSCIKRYIISIEYNRCW